MTFLGRFLRGKPAEPPTPPINDDWTVGDIAECIIDAPWCSMYDLKLVTGGPRLGERFRVVGVQCHWSELIEEKIWFLKFSTTGCTIFQAEAFRKVRPVHDAAVVEDKAFLKSLLRTSAPQKEDA